ncbi:MAG TPA: LPS export ABC transporter periplasmic protein LptC [Alphaproteobacteria bacterium]|nr:LPS export ABC transporter periplasmic protein LptC [Alphaproteobacteria bacterium]
MTDAARMKSEEDARERLRFTAPRPLAELAGSHYSAFVGAMKVMLPAIGLGLILLVAAWPEFRNRVDSFHIGIAKMSAEDIENLRMINPRYQGLDNRGEPYTVTARSAVKRNPKSDLIELDSPQADITLQRGNWVTLKSDYGAYREQDQQLNLVGSVSLFQDEGYEFHTLSAHIDMANNTADGDDPVQGQGPAGQITSQGFRILDKGARIIFTGKAHLLLYPRANGVAGG